MLIWILSTMWTLQADIQTVDNRVTVIEANRFTSKDGVEPLKQFNAAIMDINIRLGEIPHLLEEIRKLTEKVDKLQQGMPE